MVKLVVAYGPPQDAAVFDEEYSNTHVPLAQKIPNVRRFDAGKVIGTPDGSPAPYHLIAELSFDTVDELRSALDSPEGQAAAADASRIATGGVTLMIAEA